MNGLKLQKLAHDRDEHRSPQENLSALLLAHARYHGLTHEEPSDTYGRAYQALVREIPAHALHRLKLPHAALIRTDREQLPEPEEVARSLASKKRRRDKEYSR